jgi:uncharacterized integral membrane protein (TIGR00697 family)
VTTSSPKIIPYKYIIFISMLFVTIDLASASVAYKMVSVKGFFDILSAATFTFPLTYCLGDIVAEVYGYHMARSLIWLNLFFQFLFASIILLSINLPSPDFWKNDYAYQIVFGSILRFVFAGTLANVLSNFSNIYLISKLKIFFKGQLFWLRSVFSTILAGFLLVSVVISVGFTGKDVDLSQTWVLFKSTFYVEILYSFVLVIPAAMIATFLKRSENVDVYDYNTNFNPFYFK